MDDPTSSLSRRFGSLMVRTVVFAAVSLALSACSGGGCGGCDAFQSSEFPEKHYDKTVETSGQVRVTEAGINFLESEISNLLKQFRSGGLDFCIPKSKSGDNTFCYKKQCQMGSKTGCGLSLKLNDSEIVPKEKQNRLDVSLDIGGLDEQIPFKRDLLIGEITCNLDLHKKNASDSTPAEIGLDLPMKFRVDKQSQLNNTTIRLGEASVDLSDMAIDFDGGVECEIAGGIASFFEGQIRDRLKKQFVGTIKQTLTERTCKTCKQSDSVCPSNASCGTQADVDVCKWDANDNCVSSPLGNEGQLLIRSAVGELVEPKQARVDTLARLADYAEVEKKGVSLGLRTGFQQVETTRCAPVEDANRPTFDPVPKSSKIFTNTKPDSGDSFMVGLGFHRRSVEHLLWSTWASGGTCLRVGTSFNELLSTQALQIFLPSLGGITRGNQPLYLRVSPQTPPKVTLGDNEISESGDSYTLDDPLATIDWKDLDLHFYAMVNDRFTRLYTTRIDMKIPIGLEPNGQGQIVPVTGDLQNAPRNIRVRNHRLLEEDEEKLKSVVPMLLGQALPELTGSLSDPIDLPTFSGYQLVLEKGDITSVENNSLIALYADLKQASSSKQLTATLKPSVARMNLRMPDRITGERVPEPAVELSLRKGRPGVGAPSSGNVEYSYRVDNGFWSMWHTDNDMTVRHPSLSLQGEHRLQVRSRFAGEPTTASEPVERTVRVDYAPPELTLERDGAIVDVLAEDAVDEPEEMNYRHRVATPDGEPLRGWSEWSENRSVDLGSLGADGPVEVEVQARDRSGHVGSTRETFTYLAGGERAATDPAEGPDGFAGGCSVGGDDRTPVGWIALLALGGLGLLVRRRGRRLAALLIGLSLLWGVGCDNDIAGGDCDPACKKGKVCKDGSCEPKSCSSDSDCACPGTNDGICLDGKCRCKTFCSSGCGEGKYCCFAEDSCKEYPDPCSDTSCDPGYEPKVTDQGQADRKNCTVDGAECSCVEKPPLPQGQYGRHTSIASRGGTTAVATYNDTYGDLMVGVLDDNLEPDWTYVDGIPEGGSIVAAPSGPRGGVEDEGPDVGQFASVAVDGNGAIHVFYRDSDDETLKYARGTSSSGTVDFSTTTLRDQTNTGFHTAAAVKGSTVHAVYTADETPVEVDGIEIEGSKFRHISFPVDTSLEMLEPKPETLHATGTRNPCGACKSKERCFLDSTTCKPVTTDCDGGCSSGESCHSGACGSIFLESDASAHRLTTGLFPEVVPHGGGLAVVFYDNIDRRVGWARRTSDGWKSTRFLSQRSGPYASGVVDSDGKLHLAFMDPVSRTLRYRPPESKSTEIIDDGVRDRSNEHLKAEVGQNVDLWLDAGGGLHVTYQDATLHQLVRSDRGGEDSWSRSVIARPESDSSYTGVRGFYAANAAPAVGVAVEMRLNRQTDPDEVDLQFHRLK